jgi:hypothetical protein
MQWNLQNIEENKTNSLRMNMYINTKTGRELNVSDRFPIFTPLILLMQRIMR